MKENSPNLNENPAIPDITGIGNSMVSKNVAPTITIGNLNITSTVGSSEQGSVREELDKVRRDTSL